MVDTDDKKGFSDEDRSAVAERLRKVVESFPTQTAAAEAAKVTVRQLRHYLSATSLPAVHAAVNLTQAAGYSLDWLMRGEGEPKRSAKTKELGPLERIVAVNAWRVRALELLKTSVPELFSKAVPRWDSDLEEEIGGALFSLLENQVPLEQRLDALKIAFEAQRIAIAAMMGKELPDYGDVD